MRKKELTPWFPASVKPVRDGVYEAIHGGWEHGFARFENGFWQFLLATPELAEATPFSHGASQNKEWRGLAKEPK